MILIADIQRAVAEHYGISPDAMREPDGLGARDWTKVRPRQIAMYLSRELCKSGPNPDFQPTRASYPRIGQRFGGRDHTTVMHACRSVKERIASDAETRSAVEHLREELAA